MAYWRSYRKFRAEANSLADPAGSEDEYTNTENMDIGEICRSSELRNEVSDSDIVDSCCDPYQIYASSSSNCSSDDIEIDNYPDHAVSPVTLRKKLATWATKNKCQRGAVDELLGILREEGHSSLPKDSRTLLATPRDVPTLERCGGQYIYLGLERGIRDILSENPSFIRNNNTIQLKINVDGLPLFKSTNAQLWPILGCFGNFPVFPIALFYGNAKPTSVEDYLDDFLQEFSRLKLSGFTFESQKISLDIHCFLCDAPARCFMKCIVGHTGYYACERCIIKGSWKGDVHQKGESPLTNHGISCIRRFPLNYMHLVCLGVTKRLLHYLKNGPKECKLSARQILEISERLGALHGRMPT